MSMSMLMAAVLLGLAGGCAGFAPAAVPAARSVALGLRAREPLLGPSALRTMPPAAFRGAQLRRSTRAARVAGSRGRTGGLRSLNAMFTGIVEEMGRVSMLKEEEMSAWDSPGKMVKGVTLTVDAGVVLDGAYEGCSIAVSAPAARGRCAYRALRTRRALRACRLVPCASKAPRPHVCSVCAVRQVNGVCLTVTKFDKERFTVGVRLRAPLLRWSGCWRPESSPLTLTPGPQP